ncbi:MAG: hypothetical protein H6673_02000 [Anaerolineales bacterium]|nr:hypothetical protein [Anaerolineales bacterium]
MPQQEAVLEVPPPELRIVPIESVLPHEEHDDQRLEPLMKRIVESNIWLHPPVVTSMPNMADKWVVLDGANRCNAVRRLGYPHILVQVVQYDTGQVQLDTWNHVIAEVDPQTIVEALHKTDDITIEESELLTAQAQLAKRYALAYLIDYTDQKRVYLITGNERDIRTRTRLLRRVVDVYKRQGVLERISSVNTSHVEQMFPDVAAVMVFPHYEPSEILYAAREDILLPPGISRHIIHGRAMRILYSLEAMIDPATPLEVKNEHLQAWVVERTQARAVRFYAESIYTFDD